MSDRERQGPYLMRRLALRALRVALAMAVTTALTLLVSGILMADGWPPGQSGWSH